MSRLRTPLLLGEDRTDQGGEAAAGAVSWPTGPSPQTQPTWHQAAAGRLGAPTTTAISHGRLQGEEASFPAEGKLEAEATPESEDAATFTGVVSLGEAGGGLGAAGRSFPPGSARFSQPRSQESRTCFFYSVIQIDVDVVLYIILNLVSEKNLKMQARLLGLINK